MNTILEFFEPVNGLGSWIGKFLILVAVSYVIVWLIALILCRIRGIGEGDLQLKIYFAWIVSFTFHLILFGIVFIAISYHFKQYGISLLYSLPYLLLIMVSLYFALTLTNKVKSRIIQLNRRIK